MLPLTALLIRIIVSIFQETGDVKFVLEGKSIHAHKLFLKMRSDHFKHMFENNWNESTGEE